MNTTVFRRLTGGSFVVGALLINVPYVLLIMNFDYPDILRQPPGDVLTRFVAGGSGLILTWLGFAWAGLPLLFGMLMLHRLLDSHDRPALTAGTAAGVIGGVVQMVGLLRWVFVVPLLAQVYTDPASTESTRAAAVVAFQAVHQYGGVAIGEHVGQMFTILWMLIVSLTILRSDLFRPWVAWLGILASGVYLLAQTELLATVIPAFPVVPESGLVGSLLWLAWMIVVGVFLMLPGSAAGQAGSTSRGGSRTAHQQFADQGREE